MRCPNCSHEGLRPPVPCPNCRFTGDPALVEELAHVAYLLSELESWTDLPSDVAEALRIRYHLRRNELEVSLGLRLPPLAPTVARQAWWEITCLEELLSELPTWVDNDWVRPEAVGELTEESQQRIQALRNRLADGPPSPAFDTPSDELALLRFLRQSLDDLQTQGGLVSEAAYAAAAADLDADIEEVEVELGLRPRPEPLDFARDVPVEGRRPALAEEPPPELVEGLPPPRKPRQPLTWDRLWQTLLSERTLRAMLFLGVFLLFAAAVMLVVFNWDRFPPVVQVLFLAAFTLAFYALGWYVRVKMELRNSGIALTATGSLLVPLDFYAVYLGGGFAPYATPEQVWLLTSAVCLVAYLATVWVVEAEFFGYLVAGAAGSLLCATLRVVGVSLDWYAAALSALALLAALLAEELRGKKSRFRLLYRPLWHAALLSVTAIMPLALGWHVVGRAKGDAFRASLAVSWWFGCFVYALGAVRLRLRALWVAAVVGLPVAVYLTQSPLFDRAGIRPAWHALGWALLALLYLAAGHRLRARSTAGTLIRGYGRAISEWGVLLALVAAVWSFLNPTTALNAATATHAVLALAAALAAWLWKRPRWLFAASFFSLVSITAGMSARELALAQLCLGWALLAVFHLALAVRLQRWPAFAAPVYAAGFALAAMAPLPPLVAGNQGLLVYALGNWIGLAAWAAWLAHTSQHSGLDAFLRRFGRRGAMLPHWAAALPLPAWLWLVWTHSWQRGSFDRAWLGVALALLAWGLVFLGRWLARRRAVYGLSWYVTGDLTSLLAPIAGLLYFAGDRALLALVFLLISMFYFVSAWRFRQRWWLEPAGVTLPVAWLLFLAHHRVLPAPSGTLLALMPASYLLGGLLLVRYRRVEGEFLRPLNVVAHGLAALAVLWGLSPLWERLFRGGTWADPDRLWAAGGQLLVGVVYGLVAWGFRRERWGHVAAWLGVSAGGIVAMVYSQGRGSSAAKAALLAVVYVLAERALLALRNRWALAPQAWKLYRRPLLIAGWTVSAGVVILALFRNLVLLGGGRVREMWAVVGLLIVVGLYALSARLFRRPLFVWLAAGLTFAPWTILTHLGWFVIPWPPRPPEYALAWLALAWIQGGLGLWLESRGARPYGFPLRVVAHLLVPFSLLWCVADPLTASTGWGLGVAFYTISAIVDHRRLPGRATPARFLYPAAGLMPVWAVYLLARFAPAAEHVHFGLLLLAFGPLGLLAGMLLRRVHPADALPVHLTAYGSALAGTLLVAHERPWLIAALLFDAALCAFSAWLHAEPMWNYPAAAFPVVALMLALAELEVNPDRHGWALIALGAVYLVAAHWLRTFRRERYAGPIMAVAYVAVALGLPPSSRDQIGAFWGYGGAAVVYALSAAWLQQPLFLTPAVALAAVPYAVALVRSPVAVENYGLWLWPGIALSLAVAHLLDFYLGAPRDFPWDKPPRWLVAAGERLLSWPGLPFYATGYLVAVVAAGLSYSLGDAARVVATLALAAAAYALATLRFRLRAWFLVAAGTAQLAALAMIHRHVGLERPARSALAFLPVTAATALLALFIERRRGEGSPFVGWRALITGWSRPMYALLAANLFFGQLASFDDGGPGSLVSFGHALLVALLASAWTLPPATYIAAGLGLVALFQRLAWYGAPDTHYPSALAILALVYGVFGCWLRYSRRRAQPVRPWIQVWETPLVRSGMTLTALALLWMAVLSAWDVIWLTFGVLFERPVLTATQVPAVQMAITVLAVAGLTYLAAALVERRSWLGYGAVAMLLVAYGLELLLFLGQREVQWYALPAGVYLLGIGYLEWREDRRTLARWIDRTAVLLLFGSAFWQSLAHGGWRYALLMGAEGLAIAWWGSARRQRRFLYSGVSAVVIAVAGQLVEPLLSVNRWIVFGVGGLLLVSIATLVERRLEVVKQLSREWLERLEDWE